MTDDTHPLIARALIGAWHPADRHKRMTDAELAAEFGVDEETAKRVKDAHLAYRLSKCARSAVFCGTLNGDAELTQRGRNGLRVAADALRRVAGVEVS